MALKLQDKYRLAQSPNALFQTLFSSSERLRDFLMDALPSERQRALVLLPGLLLLKSS